MNMKNKGITLKKSPYSKGITLNMSQILVELGHKKPPCKTNQRYRGAMGTIEDPWCKYM